MSNWKIKLLALLLTVVVFSGKALHDIRKAKKTAEVVNCER